MKNRRAGRFGLLFLWSYAQIAGPFPAAAPCLRRRALPPPPRPACAAASCTCRRALRLPPRPACRRRFFLCGCGAHPGRGQCTRFKKTLECSFLFHPLAPAGRFLSAAVCRMTPENGGAIKTKYQQMYFLVWSQNEQAYKMSMNHINIFHNFFIKKS